MKNWESVNVPSPLKEVLRHYYHVEWIDEEGLVSDMNSPNWSYNTDEFFSQLASSIEDSNITPADYYKITGDDYDDQEEVVDALKDILQDLQARGAGTLRKEQNQWKESSKD